MLRLPIIGGKGLFETKSKQTSTISPAQQELISAANPLRIALTNLVGKQFGLGRAPAPSRGDFAPDSIGMREFRRASRAPRPLEQIGPGVGERFADTLRLSQPELDLAGIIGESGRGVADTLRSAIPDLTGELDTSGFTAPLFRRFEEETLPAIRSKAIQLGAPGGSREGEVTGRALTRFGTGVGEALGRAELGRRGVATQAFRSLLPQLFEAETAGGKQAAQTGSVARALAGQRELAPLDLLIRAISGTPRPAFAPPTVTQRDRGRPIDDIFDIGSAFAAAFG